MNRADPKFANNTEAIGRPKPAAARHGSQKADLTTKLIAGFADMLAGGVLLRGAKLPPERELAKLFGVSRNSLRRALRILQVIGLVEQRTGHGTSLNVDTPQILGEPMR